MAVDTLGLEWVGWTGREDEGLVGKVVVVVGKFVDAGLGMIDSCWLNWDLADGENCE